MTEQRQKALSTLVRWREFQESMTEVAYQRHAHQANQARDAQVAAQAVVDMVEQRQRDAWTNPNPALDLAYVEVLAAIGEVARDDLGAKTVAHTDAERVRVEALAAHHAARTAVQVVQQRRDGSARAHQEAAEKRMFDQMQDLRNGSRGAEHA